jgi:hypothetical protein
VSTTEKITVLRGMTKPLLIFGIPLVLTTFFSMFSSPGIRSLRNPGIAACYLCLFVGLGIVGWKRTLLAWVAIGLLSGLLYFGWEWFSYSRSTDADRTRPSPSTVPFGLIGWPIMAPEAVEYFLADLGVLPSGPGATAARGASHEAASPNGAGGSK